MENMEIWNKVKRPPETALKKIMGGRLKGFTDVNPQWRYQIMVETFGPCGIGWRYEISKLWNEPGSDGQVFAFALVNLFITDSDGVWCEAIPGIGGSMLIAKEKAGTYSSDEAYKMAVTDALSVAMKMIGVAADIYAGLFDGSKYCEIKVEKEKPPVTLLATKEQSSKIFELGKEAGLNNTQTIDLVMFYKQGDKLMAKEADDLIENFSSVLQNYKETKD